MRVAHARATVVDERERESGYVFFLCLSAAFDVGGAQGKWQ